MLHWSHRSSFCLFLAITLCTLQQVSAQNPYTAPTAGQPLVITTQTQLDAFTNGSGKYTSMDVGLILDGSATTFTDLSNLTELAEIAGTLQITGWGMDDAGSTTDPVAAFSSLTTLESLAVGADTDNNPGIQSISSTTLSSVQERIDLIRCINASTVAFPNVATLGNTFFIDSLVATTTLDFTGLTSVGNNLQVEECLALTDLRGLRSLEDVGGTLSILRNDALLNLDSLGVAAAGGRPTYRVKRLVIRGNPLIENLTSLSATVSRDLVLVNNDQLTELGPIALAASVNSIEFGRHPNLSDLSGVLDGATTQTTKRFFWYENPAYSTVSSRPIQVTDELQLEDLTTATFFDFSPTTSLSNGGLTLANNAQLTDLSFLQNLTTASVFNLVNNAALTTLDDLTGLSSISTLATLTDNAALGNCCLFPNQVTLNGAPADETNASLTLANNTGGCTDKNSLATACSGTLPVHWVSATAYQDAGGVTVSWTTAREWDHAYYVVERAVPGGSFAPIGRIQGDGNRSEITRYEFADHNPPAVPAWYYRIKQVDADGTYSFSQLLTVRADESVFDLTVYPNPVRVGQPLRLGLLSSTTRNRQVSLYDMYGRLRYTGKAPASIPTGSLSAGRYQLRLTGTRKTLTRLVVVTR